MLSRPRLFAIVATVSLVVAAAIALGSRSERGSPAAPEAERTGSVRATAGDGACTAAQARQAVERFVRAFNGGDAAALKRAFAPEGDFQWYTVDDPSRPRDLGADDRRALFRYLARRQRANERLRLESFAFNGNNGAFGHFEFTAVRRASDLASRRYEGKGAALCAGGSATIAAWAMGREAR